MSEFVPGKMISSFYVSRLGWPVVARTETGLEVDGKLFFVRGKKFYVETNVSRETVVGFRIKKFHLHDIADGELVWCRLRHSPEWELKFYTKKQWSEPAYMNNHRLVPHVLASTAEEAELLKKWWQW